MINGEDAWFITGNSDGLKSNISLTYHRLTIELMQERALRYRTASTQILLSMSDLFIPDSILVNASLSSFIL
jgi:hypothetical protein